MRFYTVLLVMSVLIPLRLSAAAVEDSGQFEEGAQKVGFYAAIGTGMFFFTDQDRSQFADGWVVTLKAGYDFLKYLGVEAQFRTSGHENNIKTSSAGVEPSFFGYQMMGLVKGAYPITKRLYVGGGVGGGFWYTKPNMKPTVGQANRGMFVGEMNIEYFLRTKGLSIGLDPQVSAIKDLKSMAMQLTGFIRHTF